MTEKPLSGGNTRSWLWLLTGTVVLLFGGWVAWKIISPSQPDAVTTQPLRVGILTWPGYGPGYIAKEKGFFGDLPVEFLILDDFSARQAAFTSGQTQLTISTFDAFAYESAKGVDGKIVMVLDESFGADAIVAKLAIKAPSDLRGKKVAFTKGSTSHFFLMVYLQNHGMSLKDIQTVEVDDPSRAGEAFAAGSVDVAVTWEPHVSQIVKTGKGHVLESTRQRPGLIVDVMVVAPKAMTERQPDIQRFVKAWLRAVDFIEEHPQESYAIMSKGLKIPEAGFPQMVKGMRYADRTANNRWLVNDDGKAAIDLFDQAASLWKSAGLIERTTVGRDRITNVFLKPVP
jgi:NitT/TauT family transport system substrate-binding protein